MIASKIGTRERALSSVGVELVGTPATTVHKPGCGTRSIVVCGRRPAVEEATFVRLISLPTLYQTAGVRAQIEYGMASCSF